MAKKKTKKTYEGLQENVRKLKLPKIDIWKNKYPDKDYLITFETSEFTCICPKTGLPDFAKIFIGSIDFNASREFLPDEVRSPGI